MAARGSVVDVDERWDFPLRRRLPVEVPLYAAGERAWCQRCSVRGWRPRLGVSRGGGLIACGRCLSAHERAGLAPSDESPHDDELCLVCYPPVPVAPDAGDELLALAVLEEATAVAAAAAAVPRSTLRQRVDELRAERAQARRTVAHWRAVQARAVDAGGTGDEVRGAGRPVLVLAAGLALWADTRTSTRGRKSKLPLVAAQMVVDASRESGRRARPGRADTAVLCGITEYAVTVHWGALENLVAPDGHVWAERMVVGGAVTLEERVASGGRRGQLRAEWALHPLPHRIVDPAVRPDLIVWAARLIAEVAQRAGALAEAAEVDVARCDAELQVLDAAEARAIVAARRSAPPTDRPAAGPTSTENYLPPPGGSKAGNSPSGHTGFDLLAAASKKILRYVPGKVRPDGRGKGASTNTGPRSSHRVKRPRMPRTMCPQALGLARDLRQHPSLPQLRRAPVPMLTALVTAYARAGWTAADVVVQVQTAIAARSTTGYRVEFRPRRPVKWLAELLDGADVDVPPAAAARAAKQAQAEQRRAETARAAAAADELAAAKADPQHAAAAAAAARAEIARRTGRVVRPATRTASASRSRPVLPTAPRDERAPAALAALDAALAEQAWPPVAQPGAGLPAPRPSAVHYDDSPDTAPPSPR